jgi:predicted TIM-barrel fold metal-dependent hydrolase
VASAFPIIDTDSHYAENIEGLWEYMEEPWRSRLKGSDLARYLPASPGDRYMAGRIDRSWRISDTSKRDPAEVKQHIVDEMARMGVHATLLVPNRLALLGHLSVRDIALVVANAHIDYHLDQVADPAAGIYTMPVLTWHDPVAGAAMIERVAGDPAVVGVCLETSHANPPWGDITYKPIFDAAARNDLPVVLHASGGLTLTERGSYADGFQRPIEAHSLSFLVSNQIHLTSMLFQGIPERYPDLKIVFLEAGVFWVPAMMFRLDEYFRKRRSEAPLLKNLPSEYMLRQFYFGTQPLEVPKNMDAMRAVFDMADGVNRFMFASDLPHWDYDEPSVIHRLNFLSREEKAKVFAGNALGVFDFGKGGAQPWQHTVSELMQSSAQAAASS